MSFLQKSLAKTVMTLSGTTIEEEFRCRNAAIDAVADLLRRCLLSLPGGESCCPTRCETVDAKGESDAVEGDQPAAGSR
jgi:hypothetical protein